MKVSLNEFYEEHKIAENYGNVMTLFDLDNGSFCRIKTNHPAAICRDYFAKGGDILVIEKRTAKVILFQKNGNVYTIPIEATSTSLSFAKLIRKYTGYHEPTSTMDKNAIFVFSGWVHNLMNQVANSKYVFNCSNFMATIFETKNWLHSIGK